MEPDRRFVIGGLFLGSLTFVPGVLAPAFASPTPLDGSPRALTPQQARVLDALAELIIPETETPGARRAGVPRSVDRALAEYHTAADRHRIVDGLDRLDADAHAAYGGDFPGLSAAQQTALLARYDAAETGRAAFFPALRDMVTIAYFTSEPGATLALRYDPLPGDYRACVPMSEIGRAWATS